MEIRKGYVKRNIVLIGLTARAIIFFMPFLPQALGAIDENFPEWFTPPAKNYLILLQLITIFYISFFIYFIIQNRHNYLRQGRPLGFLSVRFAYFALIGIHVFEFWLFLKVKDDPMFTDHFFVYIVLAEAALAGYAAFYYRYLFGAAETKNGQPLKAAR